MIDSILYAIQRAHQPVILIGNGVRQSYYYSPGILRKILDRFRIPVLTTWRAADLIPEDYPYFIGRPGAVGQRAANMVQQKADFILVLGARLDSGQVAYRLDNFAPGARIAAIDIDLNEINKLPDPDYSIEMDASCFLYRLTKKKIKRKRAHKYWLRYAKELKEKYPIKKEHSYSVLTPYSLIDRISAYTEEGDIIVAGSSGACSEVTMQAIKLKEGQRLINSPGLGAMGFGVSAAIGVAVASCKKVICIEGDGSLCMNMQELEIVRRLSLPIVFFILNNGGYASIRNTQNKHFEGRYVASSTDSGLTLPNVRDIASCFGLNYILLNKYSGMDHIVAPLLDKNFKTPTICDVTVPYIPTISPIVTSKRNEDGSFSMNGMEDMWPEI